MAYHGSPRLRGYSEEIYFALEVGEGPTLRQGREALAHLMLSDQEVRELAELDLMVLETLQVATEIGDYLLKDHQTQPLTDWWWHLGKLRAGTYPTHLLPPHLREIYQPTKQRLAA